MVQFAVLTVSLYNGLTSCTDWLCFWPIICHRTTTRAHEMSNNETKYPHQNNVGVISIWEMSKDSIRAVTIYRTNWNCSWESQNTVLGDNWLCRGCDFRFNHGFLEVMAPFQLNRYTLLIIHIIRSDKVMKHSNVVISPQSVHDASHYHTDDIHIWATGNNPGWKF